MSPVNTIESSLALRLPLGVSHIDQYHGPQFPTAFPVRTRRASAVAGSAPHRACGVAGGPASDGLASESVRDNRYMRMDAPFDARVGAARRPGAGAARRRSDRCVSGRRGYAGRDVSQQRVRDRAKKLIVGGMRHAGIKGRRQLRRQDCPLRIEPGPLELYRRHDTGERLLSCRTCKSRADARLLAAIIPLQHTQRIAREPVNIETRMQGIEATPHHDDVRGGHDDRVLAAAALHGERP